MSPLKILRKSPTPQPLNFEEEKDSTKNQVERQKWKREGSSKLKLWLDNGKCNLSNYTEIVPTPQKKGQTEGNYLPHNPLTHEQLK